MSEPNALEQVVIAEDSGPNRKILAHLLKKLGYDVIACENGDEAWHAITNPQNTKIVAILSDVMMPVMDGLSLLKVIRGSEAHRSIPFVLITALSDKNLVKQAAELNVDGYILKPVTFQRVEAKMKELFPEKVFPKLVA